MRVPPTLLALALPLALPAPAQAPALGEEPLFLEVEELAGPWRLQTNYPGYSGRGFRVSNAAGIAESVLETTLEAARAGRVAVWARGLEGGGQDRSFLVEVAGVRLPATHGGLAGPAFRWHRCGEADLPAGKAVIRIHDAGPGFECPDLLVLAPDLGFRPDPWAGLALPAEAAAPTLASRNRAALIAAAGGPGAAGGDLRGAVAAALGLDPPPPRTPLAARAAGRLERAGYTIEKVVFESRPGFPVTANLYLPAGGSGPRPAVLCPVGHWGLAKAEPVVQARCVGLARLGFAVLAYDPFGQGERAGPGNEHSLGLVAALLGESNMTYMVWDSVRALDYLLSRPEVDGARLAVTGCSGGGLNTLYLAAVDGRWRAAAPAAYVCAFRDFLATGIDHCPCSHVPGLAALTDMGAILGACRPRPLLLLGGRRDPLFPDAGLAAAAARVRAAYAAEGAAEGVELFVDECGHDYSRPMRERLYGFLCRRLLGEDRGERVAEGDFVPEPPAALACFPGGKLPRGALTVAELLRRGLRRRLEAARTGPERLAALRAALGPAGEAAVRVRVLGPAEGGELLLLEDDLGHVGRALLLPGREGVAPVAVLAGELPRAVWRLKAAGVPLLVVQPPFATGELGGGHWARTSGLLVDRQPAALWAAHLAAAARHAARGGRPRLLAGGPEAAVAALGAAALLAGPVDLAAASGPTGWFDLWGRPDALLRRGAAAGDVPGLLAALAAAGSRILWAGTSLGEAPPGVAVAPGDEGLEKFFAPGAGP